MVTEKTARIAATMVGLVASLGRATFAQAPTAAPRTPRAYHIFLTGKAKMVVSEALDGAVRRLASPQCQQLFNDFADSAGQTLANTLEAWGTAAGESLADLYFVDGDASVQCRGGQATAAFTMPHSRVIFLCGTQFPDRFARKTAGGEILLIHTCL